MFRTNVFSPSSGSRNKIVRNQYFSTRNLQEIYFLRNVGISPGLYGVPHRRPFDPEFAGDIFPPIFRIIIPRRGRHRKRSNSVVEKACLPTLCLAMGLCVTSLLLLFVL
jgi:hypothetical protein